MQVRSNSHIIDQKCRRESGTFVQKQIKWNYSSDWS